MAEELLAAESESDSSEVAREATLRTVISRAYYAAFLSARAALHHRVISVPAGGASHRGVWDRFHAMGDGSARRVANDGRRLRARRATADYEDYYPNIETHAHLAVRLAQRLLADLQTLDHEAGDR